MFCLVGGVYNGCDLFDVLYWYNIFSLHGGFLWYQLYKHSRYQSYGNDCQQRCKCAEHQFNVMKGCIDIGENVFIA